MNGGGELFLVFLSIGSLPIRPLPENTAFVSCVGTENIYVSPQHLLLDSFLRHVKIISKTVLATRGRRHNNLNPVGPFCRSQKSSH